MILIGYFTPQPGARGNEPMWNLDEHARLLTLHRTIAIDATLERFRLQQVLLPPLDMLPSSYPAHLGAVVRQNVELPGGQVRAEYRSIGADDYLHAEVFALASSALFWRQHHLTEATRLVPALEAGDFEPMDLTSYAPARTARRARPR